MTIKIFIVCLIKIACYFYSPIISSVVHSGSTFKVMVKQTNVFVFGWLEFGPKRIAVSDNLSGNSTLKNRNSYKRSRHHKIYCSHDSPALLAWAPGHHSGSPSLYHGPRLRSLPLISEPKLWPSSSHPLPQDRQEVLHQRPRGQSYISAKGSQNIEETGQEDVIKLQV